MKTQAIAVLGLSLLFAGQARAEPPARVKGQVKPYTVSAELKELANAKLFAGSAEQRALLAKNLFVVTPTDQQQLFFIYENNAYGNIPSFVTTDLVLQLFHVFYGFTLRRIEEQRLLPLLRQMTTALLRRSIETHKAVEPPEWKQAALKNVAYYGTAARLLDPRSPVPAEAAAAVTRELSLIEKHAGLDLGAVLPYKIDYSQFAPRGHYTRTEALKRYFKAMVWYGLTPLAFRKQVAVGKPAVPSEETVRMGLLLAHDLYAAKMAEAWERLYEPTAFLVGVADDLTPAEYKTLSDEVFGKDATPERLADRGRFAEFIARGLKLRMPRIQARVRHILGLMLPFPDPATPQLRFMGQRHIPDAEITQRLTDPGRRFFPAGLDVMAVLGSSRAAWLLDQGHPALYQTKTWPAYGPERARLAADFGKLTEAEWTRNVYWGWLWALQALLLPVPEGYPSFMRSEAWQDRSLSSALASWAELRHDTILYGKQSFTAAECGGDEERPQVKHYVEPNPELFRRLLVVTRLAREGLVKRKLITAPLKDKFDRFMDLLVFLGRAAEKELANQALTQKEHEQLRIIGASVEYLTLSIMQERASSWAEIVSPTDKNMAVIADVHTGGMGPELKALEEAVGLAQEILVVVPAGGKLQLARGAVFSYYEFLQPYAQRLTDEAWQKLLKAGKAPPPPPWMRSFTAPAPGRKGTLKVHQYSSGC